jgi:elongation factor Ts
MSVDVQLVKQLRDATYASLKDCKTALEETNGDLEAATQWLVKKWVANAAKKADRELNDGQVKVIINNGRLTVFKVGCETDFVAKNEMFAEMLETVSAIIGSASGEIATMDQCDPAILAQAQEAMAQYMAKLGENIQIVDIFATDLGDMQAASYLHNGGKIAAVVMYRNGTDTAAQTAKQVAMQIAAMNPQYMTMGEIPASEVEAKRAEFEAELKAGGKPEAMIAQIAEGKINKYFADLVLMNQWYIGDEGTTIAHLIDGVFEFAGARRFSI